MKRMYECVCVDVEWKRRGRGGRMVLDASCDPFVGDVTAGYFRPLVIDC